MRLLELSAARDRVHRMSTERDRLLNEIDQFQAVSGLSDTAFGTEALNDPNWLFRFRKGGDPKLGTVDRVRSFMRGWRPKLPHPNKRAEARSVA